MIDLKAVHEKHGDEYMKFEDLESEKFSDRPDLQALIMLDKLMPGNRDMVSAAEHDEIWLDVDCERLAEIITASQFVDLMRCGVMYDDDVESLSLFV